MRRNAKNIAEKMQILSEEQIAGVEDFRVQELETTRAAAKISEPAFQAIWNNPEDDAYDVAFARL